MPDVINPKDAIGRLKVPLDLLPPVALQQEAWVMKHGADKYGAWNWRSAGISTSVYYAACMRHLLAMIDGEDIDPDSGIHHAAHIRAGMGILLDATDQGMLIDDRPFNHKKRCVAH